MDPFDRTVEAYARFEGSTAYQSCRSPVASGQIAFAIHLAADYICESHSSVIS